MHLQMKRRITDQLDAQETGSVKHSQPATLQHASTDTTELGADGFPVPTPACHVALTMQHATVPWS